MPASGPFEKVTLAGQHVTLEPLSMAHADAGDGGELTGSRSSPREARLSRGSALAILGQVAHKPRYVN